MSSAFIRYSQTVFADIYQSCCYFFFALFFHLLKRKWRLLHWVNWREKKTWKAESKSVCFAWEIESEMEQQLKKQKWMSKWNISKWTTAIIMNTQTSVLKLKALLCRSYWLHLFKRDQILFRGEKYWNVEWIRNIIWNNLPKDHFSTFFSFQMRSSFVHKHTHTHTEE